MLKRLGALFCTLILIVPLLSSCTSQERKSVSGTFFIFETIAQIRIYDTDDESLLDKCKEFLDRYEDVFSATRSTSELYKINSSRLSDIEISEDIYVTVKKALEVCEMTQGRFDITIRPVSKLYNFTAEGFVPPDDEEIKNGLQSVSYRNISVGKESGRYFLHKENADTELDLGAVSKGYISDRLKDYMRSIGIKNAMIDLCGNIMCLADDTGNDPDAYKIGVFDPTDIEGKDPVIVNVSDSCVITSGTYQRNAEYNGKLYHHILDARNGLPAQGDLVSVCVVCKEGIMGDLLSTGLFLLGEEGIEAELPENTGVLYIYEDGTRKYAGNFKDLM
ncbi:MAG: FAD:protein FMN transferase [Lachnospiraceae bacterium]|nr:FAD:protein FMN transferase [Lachnospiraceae bacterium]